MDAGMILDIVSKKKSRREIIQALEVLCDPRSSLKENERNYRVNEQIKKTKYQNKATTFVRKK